MPAELTVPGHIEDWVTPADFAAGVEPSYLSGSRDEKERAERLDLHWRWLAWRRRETAVREFRELHGVGMDVVPSYFPEWWDTDGT